MSYFVWAEIPGGSSLRFAWALCPVVAAVGGSSVSECEAGENPGTRGITGTVPSGFPSEKIFQAERCE